MASMEPLVAKRNLTVDFAPEFVKVSVRPDRPRAGHNATLVCETASSYPAASITWWTNGEKLDGATEMIVDGAYGGFVTSSHLQLSLTPQHHGVVVTCDASNDIANQRAHDAVTLSIARKCAAAHAAPPPPQSEKDLITTITTTATQLCVCVQTIRVGTIMVFIFISKIGFFFQNIFVAS